MKRLFIIICLLIVPMFRAYADKIYLKTGRIVEGKIIEETDKNVIIKETFGNSHVISGYRKLEIERIKKSSAEEKIKEKTKRKKTEIEKRRVVSKDITNSALDSPNSEPAASPLSTVTAQSQSQPGNSSFEDYKEHLDKIIHEIEALKSRWFSGALNKENFKKWYKEFKDSQVKFKGANAASLSLIYQAIGSIEFILDNIEVAEKVSRKCIEDSSIDIEADFKKVKKEFEEGISQFCQGIYWANSTDLTYSSKNVEKPFEKSVFQFSQGGDSFKTVLDNMVKIETVHRKYIEDSQVDITRNFEKIKKGLKDNIPHHTHGTNLPEVTLNNIEETEKAYQERIRDNQVDMADNFKEVTDLLEKKISQFDRRINWIDSMLIDMKNTKLVSDFATSISLFAQEMNSIESMLKDLKEVEDVCNKWIKDNRADIADNFKKIKKLFEESIYPYIRDIIQYCQGQQHD